MSVGESRRAREHGEHDRNQEKSHDGDPRIEALAPSLARNLRDRSETACAVSQAAGSRSSGGEGRWRAALRRGHRQRREMLLRSEDSRSARSRRGGQGNGGCGQREVKRGEASAYRAMCLARGLRALRRLASRAAGRRSPVMAWRLGRERDPLPGQRRVRLRHGVPRNEHGIEGHAQQSERPAETAVSMRQRDRHAASLQAKRRVSEQAYSVELRR